MTLEGRKLEQLREWRGRKDRDLTVQQTLAKLKRSLKRSNSQLLQIAEVWKAEVPEFIYEQTHPISLHDGSRQALKDGLGPKRTQARGMDCFQRGSAPLWTD